MGKNKEDLKNEDCVCSTDCTDGNSECCCHKECSCDDKAKEVNNEEIEILKKKNAELEDKVKYGQAELINYRKRKDEETSNMLKYANQDLILEIIPIADNFERAIKYDDENGLDDTVSKFLEGFKILYSHLTDTLKKFGVEEIETVGKEFDPNVHEALMTTKDVNKPDDIITECLLKGYTLKGKVIRPAKVIVNKIDE